MKAKKILFITQEMTPFVPESENALFGKNLPKSIQENGHEIRTFTPKWGIINERRNQLHEVIRLSGMNIIIDDTDHPLIIKVASLQQARMQIYFIDNDDYFMKRMMEKDENGIPYPDNGERAIFYARGVLETVKKLKWTPDVIHCQGWISSIVPIYIKKAYNDEPSYAKCKIVYSATEPKFQLDFGEHFLECIQFKDIELDDLKEVFNGKYGFTELQKLAIKYSDGIILNDNNVDKEVIDYGSKLGKLILGAEAKEDYKNTYSEFYEAVMG